MGLVGNGAGAAAGGGAGVGVGGRMQVPNTLNNREGLLLIPSTRALINNEFTMRLQSSSLSSVAGATPSTPTPTPTPPVTTDPRIKNNSSKNNHTTLELSEMTCGTIADLAKVQSEYRMEQSQDRGDQEEEEANKQKRWYYEPLKPFELPVVSKTPHIEPGRVEIRLMSLMDALNKLD